MIAGDNKVFMFPDKEKPAGEGGRVDVIFYALVMSILLTLGILCLHRFDEFMTSRYDNPDNEWLVEHHYLGSLFWKVNRAGLTVPMAVALHAAFIVMAWLLQRRKPSDTALFIVRGTFVVEGLIFGFAFFVHMAAALLGPLMTSVSRA